MDKYCSIKMCNYEFPKWALQVPTMSAAEQIFHNTQGLKTTVRVDVEGA